MKKITDVLRAQLEADPNQGSPDLGLLLRDLAEQARLDRLTFAAFPAETAEETGPIPFDAVLDKDDVAEMDPEEVADA